ncbi:MULTISPECIES: proteasome-activating nucleotidase [Acidianus]|uniref:Proteasome-activating nucleotidase n=1 Tax=Candidatus Acidianus copahuensis TaxID=1160895 RepID=A0A031LJT2_9CREN|nr:MULTISPECIES: proteasome-activating nucleotidase [Acidianus]EZQ03033.1 nucleotidase [Candidatus Acidianus copahuensis]NON62362.1 proteasome-activating nucleotidase [Acidianus sp. RZ1]
MSGELDLPRDRYSSDNYEQIIRILEEKLTSLQAETESLRKELNYYKSELEKLLSPPLVEATILDIIDNEHVIVKSTSGPNLVVTVSNEINTKTLEVGQLVALNQRGSTIVKVLPNREEPFVKSMEIIERPDVKYTEIGGLSQQIHEIREVIELPLKEPELFREMGIQPPKGVLLYGPPGTGKTLLAKAVASESNATFIHIVASEFAQKFVGEGARVVREVFELAREKSPSIVFIDEIDAIGAKRVDLGTSGEREIQRTMMQLLAELDGFQPLDNVKIIAATNRIDILDPALLRPGRFDRIIEISLPNFEGRKDIFNIYLSKMKVAIDEIDLDYLSRQTDGLSGADIKNICTEAGYFAIRNNEREIHMRHFIAAINKIKGNKKQGEYKDREEKYT